MKVSPQWDRLGEFWLKNRSKRQPPTFNERGLDDIAARRNGWGVLFSEVGNTFEIKVAERSCENADLDKCKKSGRKFIQKFYS